MKTRLMRSILLLGAMAVAMMAVATARAAERTETFDRDPQWDGLNNRAAQTRKIRQDFGYRDGKIGGIVSLAGECAYYARKIPAKTVDDVLSASGRLICKNGSGMALIGFFNADTANAWRTPHSIFLRILGRGKQFFVYEEYDTRLGRAGSNQFTGHSTSGRYENGLSCGESAHEWSLSYDPKGNDGGGTVSATIDGRTTITNLDPGHKQDGARFNRFGILNVMKHADDPEELWIDNLTINGEKQDLSADPKWEAHQNRREYETHDVRPFSDYGFSPTHYAGGKAAGELGGLIFRGDIRLANGVNYYGDRIGLLSLENPLKASGKIAFVRGVTDSSTLIGFFHVPRSVTIDPKSRKSPRSWTDYVPKDFLGVALKGPTREGFFFHPTYRLDGDAGGGNPGNAIANCPRIFFDGHPHDWSLEYAPAAADGNGQITVSLDGKSAALDLEAGHRAAGAQFNRFGIVSTWVDGNGQVVYLDDLTYTLGADAPQGETK
jgi:hypothetical protein